MDNKDKVYLFKVSLPRLKVYREMAVEGTSSLHKFAEVITGAFDFQMDHAFGFYSNTNARQSIYDSTEVYTSFKDEGGKGITPNEKSVKNSYIHEVFEPNKKMIFLFDYGDEWDFLVECKRIIEAEAGTTYPKVTKKKGDAPRQYPEPYCDSDYDEEDDDDDENE